MFGLSTRPRAVIVMSAHWRSLQGFNVGFQPRFETMHDFTGFPDPLYQFKYPAIGERDLAQHCVDLLKGAAQPSELDLTRGLDHGVYVPLHFIWPRAEVPVIPLAISKKASPQEIFRVGEIIAPLRNEGVMVIGSGGLVHNLGRLFKSRSAEEHPESWAVEFEDWAMKALHDRDFTALCDFKEHAPHANDAHPTWEHLAPLFFTVGAASAWNESLQELYRGWSFGNLSMTCLGYGVSF
jgi:4,5-DOPA dioxygenase extradiol